MQSDDARACVGTGWGSAHIASTVYERGPEPVFRNSAFLRTCAGESDRVRLRGAGEGAVEALFRSYIYQWYNHKPLLGPADCGEEDGGLLGLGTDTAGRASRSPSTVSPDGSESSSSSSSEASSESSEALS